MEIVRIDVNGRSAQDALRRATEANPDQAVVVYVSDNKIIVDAGGNDDRLWRMGALSAALIEEWTFDSK